VRAGAIGGEQRISACRQYSKREVGWQTSDFRLAVLLGAVILRSVPFRCPEGPMQVACGIRPAERLERSEVDSAVLPGMARPERSFILAGESPVRVAPEAPGSGFRSQGEIRALGGMSKAPVREGSNPARATTSERNSLDKLSVPIRKRPVIQRSPAAFHAEMAKSEGDEETPSAAAGVIISVWATRIGNSIVMDYFVVQPFDSGSIGGAAAADDPRSNHRLPRNRTSLWAFID
jgi:hypothetical protein